MNDFPRHALKAMNPFLGFSLVELLIVLAILGTLALVAYPSYQDSIRKTRRSDGIAAALGIQVAQERFRGNCPFYAQSLGPDEICGASAAASAVAAPTISDQGFYALSIEAGSASGDSYVIVLAPQGAQAKDASCDPMRITFNAANSSGLKSPAACW